MRVLVLYIPILEVRFSLNLGNNPPGEDAEPVLWLLCSNSSLAALLMSFGGPGGWGVLRAESSLPELSAGGAMQPSPVGKW